MDFQESLAETDPKDHQPNDAMSGEATIAVKEVDSQFSGSNIEEPPRKKQKHTISPRIVSDAILGLSDGLTVPFALTAGLSALGTSRLVVLGGLAELMAGAISMGLGGFVGAKSEA
jgi:VIT1/CCC1 family predicted Fe2+/Mn2+ transporter